MKKNTISLLIIIIFLLVILIPLKGIDINIFNKKDLSLHQIKEQLLDTRKIYICKYSNNLTKACSGKDLIRIEKEEEIVRKIVNIIVSLDTSDETMDKMKDNHTLYFMDENNNVIISADFGFKLIIKTKNKEYNMNPVYNEKLRDMLEFEF